MHVMYHTASDRALESDSFKGWRDKFKAIRPSFSLVLAFLCCKMETLMASCTIERGQTDMGVLKNWLQMPA